MLSPNEGMVLNVIWPVGRADGASELLLRDEQLYNAAAVVAVAIPVAFKNALRLIFLSFFIEWSDKVLYGFVHGVSLYIDSAQRA